MRRIITIALLVLTAAAGTAAADRHRGGRNDGRHDGRNRVVTRDNRFSSNNNHNYSRSNNNNYSRSYNRGYHRDYRYVDRRPVYVNNGRYNFNGGYSRSYVRPVHHYRYYNYRVRPQILIENYDAVPGYVWITGNWSWNNYEWIWTPGHYEVDVSYQYSY